MKEEGADRIYSDKLEIIVMELPKLPPEAQTEEGVLSWMRFFSGKKKEDFVKMAERDPYLKEAYEELERLSADLEKRYEYEAREKALRDHISFLEDAKERGLREGLEKGLEKGLEQAARLFRSLLEEGRLEEMRRAVNDLEYQKKLVEQYGVQESLDN